MLIQLVLNLKYSLFKIKSFKPDLCIWGVEMFLNSRKCKSALNQTDLCHTKGAFTPDANDANKLRYLRVVGRLNILSLITREIRFIRAWNSLQTRHQYASWEGLLPGSSSLVAIFFPVFVKVLRCIYSSGYSHTTTITLSSIVVSDFLPPLIMTSLLEQAPDWLMRREYPPKFWFFNSRDSCYSLVKRSIRAA